MQTQGTIGRSGVLSHYTHNIYDSSKVQSFMDCPRGFFYSYVLGWRWAQPNVHLIFGSAWHEAQEYLLSNKRGDRPNGWTPADVLGSYNAFKDLWEEYYPPDVIGELPSEAKNLGGALQGLSLYAGTFKDNPINTLHTEIHGTVPIGHNRIFHVKLDTLRKHPVGHINEGKLFCLEHKTTGRKSKTSLEKWNYLFQISAYAYFIWVLAKEDHMVDGVHVNLGVFRNTSQEFLRIPVQKNLRQHEEWVSDANYWIDQIEQEMEHLSNETDSQRVMRSFPRNSMSCSKFGCRYPGLCGIQCNPLQRLDRIPIGMGVEFWDPARGPDLREPKVDIPVEDPKMEVEELVKKALEG